MPTLDLGQLSGLSAAKKALRGVVSGGSVHAVLLYGAEGSGKSKLADWLAKAWLCASPGPNGGCGECKPCLAFERGNSADVLIVAPRGASNWIKLNQIVPRPPKSDDEQPPPIPIQEFLRTAPLISAHKVISMRDVDRLFPDSENSLLKMLEEPESYGKFVLTTEEVRRVHETILSRCLCLACEMPGQGELDALLGPLADWEQALSGGSPGIVQRLRAGVGVYEPLYRFAEGLSSRPHGAALRAAEEFRALCERLGDHEGHRARAANVEGLKVLAGALGRLSWPAEKVQAVVETHRRVAGNASMGLATDALFARLLG